MTVRALVVGLGAIGQRHARNLRALLGDELVLSALRSRRHAAVVTDQVTIGSGHPEDDCDGGVFTDLGEALALRPDLVVIANPTRFHLEVARAAIEVGAAVFVEKPLADELAGVDELVALAAEKGVVAGIGCQLRFHPALVRLRELLEKEAVGRLVAVHVEEGEYLPGWHPYEDYRQSYAARRELGGGVVLTQIHELDYVHWLFGMPRRVFAVGGSLSDLDIDVEDTASALLECSVDCRRLPVHVHLDYRQRPPRRTCRVTGDTGTIEVDLRAPALVWTDSDGAVIEKNHFPGFARAQLFVDELDSFLESVRSGGLPEVGLAHAADTLRLALAVRRSLEHGTLETLA